MTSTTKRRQQGQGLGYWLDRRGFTAESDDPAEDGTVQIRVLRPKRDQPRRFPESFYIVPADDMGESFWASKIRKLLEIPEDQKLRIIPVSGWFPRPGSEYRVRIRRGRGGLVYAFPAERHSLQDGSWRPGPTFLQGGKWTFRKGKEVPGRPQIYSAQHPETGQYVLCWGEVPIPAGAQEALVDMAGLMIRPVRTASYWIAGKPRVIEGLTEGQMAVYDEDLVHRIFLATTSHAPEIRILGEDWSPPEIFGTPRPVRQSDSALLGQEFEKVLDGADTWRRRELMPAVHPDSWPKEVLVQLLPANQRERAEQILSKMGEKPKEDEGEKLEKELEELLSGPRRHLSEAAGDIYAQVELAWEWYVTTLKRMEENIRRVLASGIPLSRKDFTLPKPEGRPQRRRPLISFEPAEIRQMMLDDITGRKGAARKETEARPTKSRVVTQAPRPAPAQAGPKKAKGKLAPQRRQGRVIATAGDDAPGSSVREAMRRALAADGQEPAAEKPKKTKKKAKKKEKTKRKKK